MEAANEADSDTQALVGTTRQSSSDVGDTAATIEVAHLTKNANFLTLFLWGVGIVISGDFTGWNFGLLRAGFGGMLTALGVVFVFYLCCCLSIAELSAHLPEAGGAFRFSQEFLGDWCGLFTAVTEFLKFLTAGTVIVSVATQMLTEISHTPEDLQMLWAGGLVVLMGVANCFHVHSLRFPAVLTVFSLVVLVVYFCTVASGFDTALLTNMPPEGSFYPFGVASTFGAIPFAMWFFLGLETLPLSAEDAYRPESIPTVLCAAFLTLACFALTTVLLTCGVSGGSLAVSEASHPLQQGLLHIDSPAFSAVLSVAVLFSLLASISLILVGNGRLLFSLARARYVPLFLSRTRPLNTPWVAVASASLMTLGLVAVSLHLSEAADAVMLQVSVCGALCSFVLQMLAFLNRRRNSKSETSIGVFKSPFGMPGAVVGLVLSVTIFISQLTVDENFKYGVFVLLGCCLLCAIYFWVWGRTRTV